MQRILPSPSGPQKDSARRKPGYILLEKARPGRENRERMKLDLFLEYRGAAVLIAWARETAFGVYMGARFSPEVENASYFRDGQRELLRFPMLSDGRRKRVEIPLDSRSPISAIRRSELILDRFVNVAGEAKSNRPAPEASAGTTVFTIPESYLGGYPCLHYEAYIIRNDYVKKFLADKECDAEAGWGDHHFPARLFPLDSFPEHSLALVIQRQRSVPIQR